ncbi:MAG TPA: hypothetical protein VD993_15660 [Chitinophagaceae bacterium]|nr:hypothetical protein [Chitinophagaceae bacterium]
MPDNTSNTRSILKNDPAFEGLDFAAMRAEGINYVAELSGKIWTDHNVHDPGITILELLCYALIDLGYRTRMPAVDIFSRDPADQSEDDNFFTPAQILTCNPVTIMDYRKLLIDIKEVKNAWLEVNEDWIDCDGNTGQPTTLFAAATHPGGDQEQCKNFLNGLYKVYIELYKGPYTPQNLWTKKERDYIEGVVEKVRQTLMAHRNLCEDFVSITVLCKEKIGVCADIELNATADAEKVYVKIIETLKAFFSPDPKYYTLKQLLQKGKPIEEIFAGRPYLPESHGFVDTDELESIPFRKEIHVSDVYNALFAIEGIRTIRKLRLRKCGSGNDNTTPGECDWKHHIAWNHTTEFSLDCSGFRFSRNEMPVSVNEKKYKAFFDLNYSTSGKVLHQEQFDALDLPVPTGIYRPDLSHFYSIQNELPRVYGITEGGIPETASNERKAWALQLKGYLLFFDQLLSNYLSQLSQLRKLFAFKNSKKDANTYFSALPQHVPDLDKLLRFGNGEVDAKCKMGDKGSLQAIPVEKSILDDLIAQDKLKTSDIFNDFDNIQYVTAADRDAAIYTVIEDLQNRNFTVYTAAACEGNWFFYIYTSSDELALISQQYYACEKAAKLAAANIAYVGSFKEHYRRSTQNNSSLSTFHLELNLSGYAVYLQQMAEDKALYMERRKAFLDHLLSRFAESFTDFALLSFDSLQEQELKQRDLIKKGKFLANYDTLGRDRGKAYNYYINGWNTTNISGFEKRVQSFAGMEDCCGQTLCHFEVMEYTGQYYWNIAAAGKNIFKSNTLFDSPEEAADDLQDFLKALKEEGAYQPVEVPLHKAHALSIQYKEDAIAYPMFQQSADKARTVGAQLHQVITAAPAPDDIFVSSEVHRLQLFNDKGETVRRTVQSFQTLKQATSAAKQLVKKINEEDWEATAADETPKAKLDLKASKSDPYKLIDISHFAKHVTTCPDEYKWHLDNPSGDLVLTSERTYPSRQAGIEALLNELTDYEINQHAFRLHDEGGYRFELVGKDGSVLASSPVFADENARTAAIDFIIDFARKENANAQYTYHISQACHWQVQFGGGLVFRSEALLADPENALNTWRKDKRAFRAVENYIWDWDDQGLQQLSVKDDRNKVIARLLPRPQQQGLPEGIISIVQSALANRTFTVETVQIESGYGFRLHDNGHVLLSGYEVYNSRGAAFFNMLRALEKAGHESMYLKSGDEGNREFTFLLKNDESQFLAEHPVLYDNEKERDDVLQRTIEFLKAMRAPANAIKEPVRFTYNITSDEKLLLVSAQKFPTIREAAENANQILIQAGDADNYRFPRDPATGEYRVTLVGPGQWAAAAPGSYADEQIAEGIRNNIVEAVSQHLYSVQVTAFPDKWRFNLQLGIEPWRAQFQSTEEYESPELALQAYKKMAGDMTGLKIQRAEGRTQLVSKQKINKSNITANMQQLQQQQQIQAQAQVPAPVQEDATADAALAISQLLHQLSTTEDKRALQRMIKKDAMAEQGTWVYRVRHRDEYFAYHLDCNNTQDTDVLIKDLYDAVTHKPDYLLICLGGDIIYKRRDAAGEYHYHYTIKARNILYPGPCGQQELVLFISTQGYESPQDAEKAFNEQYLTVLKRASKSFNYGEDKYISLEETFFAPGDSCAQESSVVYVPKETLENYYGNDTAAAVDVLTELAKSYPIRLSGRGRYKFSLYDYKKKRSYFISAAYYDSPTEAMKAFMFLLVLVKNKKNYYIYCDPDTGNSFIVIREILLESNRRFLTEADAWGREGIEKLVAVSQTEGAFHIYNNPDDCCFSFFVACKSKIIHPCTYDTPATRDEALRKLYQGLSTYQVPELPVITVSADQQYYLVSYKGNSIAELPVPSGTQPTAGLCNATFFDFIEWLLKVTKLSPVTENGYLVLKDAEDPDKVWARVQGIAADDWKEMLIDMAIQFPFFRKDGHYYFRIPYPNTADDQSLADPCGCDEQLPPDPRDCYTAWIGGCYNTCEEAITALDELPDKLKEEENYRPVFDCTCGSYRIELIAPADIVAVNPQCYASREMVCEAVERAKCLINCEGMHLVEHILLRPRINCEGHCDCLIPNCPDYDCDAVWKETEEKDPCKPAGSNPCFVPGLDPYSCIATVVLPAWSSRFRKQPSRDLVARILQREAPSHILLRILWMSPKDFFAFETQYRSWLRWLASKKDHCNGPFDQCAFIDFLFNTRLDCWWPDDYCQPCNGEVVTVTPCSELNNQEDRGATCSTTINDIYCWTTPDCCYEHRYVQLNAAQEAEKVKLIRRRTAQYKEHLQAIAHRWPEDRNIGHAVSFIQGNAADETGLLRVIKNLTDELNDDTPEKNKVYKEVSNTLLNFYLDRSLLDQHDPAKLSDIRRTIHKLALGNRELASVPERWSEPELKTFVHEKTLQALRGIFKNK